MKDNFDDLLVQGQLFPVGKLASSLTGLFEVRSSRNDKAKGGRGWSSLKVLRTGHHPQSLKRQPVILNRIIASIFQTTRNNSSYTPCHPSVQTEISEEKKVLHLSAVIKIYAVLLLSPYYISNWNRMWNAFGEKLIDHLSCSNSNVRVHSFNPIKR